MRAPNAIDFWRGIALVMIFVNHVPGMIYSRLTLHDYAISDAAELFVFLAGCSLVFVTGRPGKRKPAGQVVSKMLGRAFTLWWSQVLILWLAIIMLGAAAIVFQSGNLFYWHNAGPAFYNSANAFLGSLMLTYQVGYFNILPMYVALLLLAAIPLLVARQSRLAAFLISLTLYVVALSFKLSLMNWPSRGFWHFNPLAWQFLLVSAYLSADLYQESERFRRLIKAAWPYAVALVGIGAAITMFHLWPSYKSLPEPKHFFSIDKGWLSPVRVVSMFAIAVAFIGAFERLRPYMPRVVEYATALGRNSLPVFCVLSLAALAGQIVRHLVGGNFVLDTMIVIVGLAVMRLTAYLSEETSPVEGLRTAWQRVAQIQRYN